jgi:hypothetical protein
MKRRHRFCPATTEPLENRVVLSGRAIFTPVHVARLATTARHNPSQAVVDQVNVAFSSFSSDYLQAEGTYLANSTPAAHSAFRNFVTQRIALLSSQLTLTFAHVPGSLKLSQTASSGGPVVLQVFLRTRIDGDAATSLLSALVGRGNGGALAPAGTSGTTATLYTDQALSAIATAQNATLNSVVFLYARSFQNHG